VFGGRRGLLNGRTDRDSAAPAGGITTRDREFHESVHSALDANGEVLVAYYLANGGGWIEWHLVTSPEEFEALLASSKPRSVFEVYLAPQLPVRCVVAAEVPAQLLAALRAHGEVLLAVRSQGHSQLAHRGTLLSHIGADDESDLQEWLWDHAGSQMLAGPHPALLPTDSLDVVVARVPDPDGVVRRAAS